MSNVNFQKPSPSTPPKQEISDISKTRKESGTFSEYFEIEEEKCVGKNNPNRKQKANGKKSVHTRKKKSEKADIEEFITNQRRRLEKKLEACEGNRMVFRKRVKYSKKSPQTKDEDFRGSSYWGVSKNKSKWQVSTIVIFKNLLKIFDLGHDYPKIIQRVSRRL